VEYTFISKLQRLFPIEGVSASIAVLRVDLRTPHYWLLLRQSVSASVAEVQLSQLSNLRLMASKRSRAQCPRQRAGKRAGVSASFRPAVDRHIHRANVTSRELVSIASSATAWEPVLSLYHNCDSTTIRLRHDDNEKLTCSFLLASNGSRRARYVVVGS